MPDRKLELGIALACVQACLLSTTALAQTLTPEQLKPTKNVGVLERSRPEYDAKGINLGAFILSPSLDVDGTYDDNIYATQTSPVDDAIVQSRAKLALRSIWTERSINLFATTDYSDYTKNNDESNFNWTGGGGTSLTVTKRLKVKLSGDYGSLHESREDSSSPPNTIHPIAFNQADGDASVGIDLYPVALSVEGKYTKYNYHSGELPNGTIVPQDYRDNAVWMYTGKADVAVTADTAIFIEARQSRWQYDQRPPVTPIDRDSVTDELLVGAQFDLTNLMRGEVAVGGFRERFSDPNERKQTGLAVDGKVEWYATQLTTVVLDFSRQTAASEVAGTSAYVGTAASVEVDHELLRNVILSGHFAYDAENYSGIDRNDHRYIVGAGASWLLNRYANLNLSYDHRDRTSRGLMSGEDYAKNVVTLGLQLKI